MMARGDRDAAADIPANSTSPEERRLRDGIAARDVHELFLRMEEAEGLFGLRTTDGTYYWDIVRRNVCVGVYGSQLGGLAAPPPPPPPSLVSTAKSFGKAISNRLARRYVVRRAPKYVFVTCQRTRRGARLFDSVADRPYDLVSENAVAVELINKAAISYLDIVRGKRTRIPPAAVRATAGSKSLSRIVDSVGSAVHKHFGISLDAYGLVSDPMAIFEANREHYRRIFSEHRPNAVVCIDNATLKGLYAAAREAQVPTFELQHGEINRRNPGYSYPRSISSSHPGLTLPTALLTFADYWNDIAHFPVTAVTSVGNDYFYQERVAADADGILMVSAYYYHEPLVELALELAGLVGQRKIYYKLHPHQFAEKAAIEEVCRRMSNIVVVSDELELSELFKRCDHVVGVHSTVTYIALQAGKKVCIYRRASYFLHDDVFAYVELFDNTAELREIIDAPHGKYFGNPDALPRFFQPFDARRFMQALELAAP
jgi:hypothetical protein